VIVIVWDCVDFLGPSSFWCVAFSFPPGVSVCVCVLTSPLIFIYVQGNSDSGCVIFKRAIDLTEYVGVAKGNSIAWSDVLLEPQVERPPPPPSSSFLLLLVIISNCLEGKAGGDILSYPASLFPLCLVLF